MTLNNIMDELKAQSDPRAVKVWKKMGMDTGKYLGVNLTKLKNLSKKIGKNHALAHELWGTGVHDAKLLATYIEKTKVVKEGQIDKWIEECFYWDLSDKFVTNVVSKTPFAAKKASQWIKSDKEFIRRSAFIILSEAAKTGKDTGIDFENYLPEIEEDLRNGMNFVKEGALYAIMRIGSINMYYNDKAIKIIDSVGTVVVDYGDTSCKTPDAISFLKSSRIRSGLK